LERLEHCRLLVQRHTDEQAPGLEAECQPRSGGQNEGGDGRHGNRTPRAERHQRRSNDKPQVRLVAEQPAQQPRHHGPRVEQQKAACQQGGGEEAVLAAYDVGEMWPGQPAAAR